MMDATMLSSPPHHASHFCSATIARTRSKTTSASSRYRHEVRVRVSSWNRNDNNSTFQARQQIQVFSSTRRPTDPWQHLQTHPLDSPAAVAHNTAELQGGLVELHCEDRRRNCECHDQFRDLVAYVDAWQWQKLRVEENLNKLSLDEEVDDTLIILQHPPVYTLGTRSSEAYLKFDAANPPFELHRTERGGEVTYHGPGQLIMYPILNLRHHAMDLHWYLRTLEDIVIGALDKACGIQARRIEGLTGVWVGDQKVAAIGVRVSRWITYHGLALNVTTDLAPFSNIIPCGISDYSVTSVAKLLDEAGRGDSSHDLLKAVHDCLLVEFKERLKVQLVPPTQRGPKPVSQPELVTKV